MVRCNAVCDVYYISSKHKRLQHKLCQSPATSHVVFAPQQLISGLFVSQHLPHDSPHRMLVAHRNLSLRHRLLLLLARSPGGKVSPNAYLEHIRVASAFGTLAPLQLTHTGSGHKLTLSNFEAHLIRCGTAHGYVQPVDPPYSTNKPSNHHTTPTTPLHGPLGLYTRKLRKQSRQTDSLFLNTVNESSS